MSSDRLDFVGDGQRVRLRDTTLDWALAVGGVIAIVAGAAQIAAGEAFGFGLVAVGAFWGMAVVRSFIVIDDVSLEVHGLWRTRTLAIDEIVGLDIHELGFFEGRGKSVLRIRLASGESVDVPAGVVPIGPSKFHGRVATAIADRMKVHGRPIIVPNELRNL